MKAARRPMRALASAPGRRYVSRTSNAKSVAASPVSSTTTLQHQVSASLQSTSSSSTPLAKLPLSTVLRSLVILSVSSSSLLLKPCIFALSTLAHPKSALLDVARNPLLNAVVKHTIYKQFNAGENKVEVQRSIRDIKSLGYRGVLLGYAREVLVGEGQVDPFDEQLAREEIQTWLDGTLKTVDMAQEGDFVALKYAPLSVPAPNPKINPVKLS